MEEQKPIVDISTMLALWRLTEHSRMIHLMVDNNYGNSPSCSSIIGETSNTNWHQSQESDISLGPGKGLGMAWD